MPLSARILNPTFEGRAVALKCGSYGNQDPSNRVWLGGRRSLTLSAMVATRLHRINRSPASQTAMRVLISTTGYPGHVLPLVPFARACIRAGHEVCVAGPGSHGALVRDAGLKFIGCGDPPVDDIRAILARAAHLPREQGHELIVSDAFARVGTRAMVGDLLQITGAWRPDIIVRESQEFSALLAAERHHVAHVRVALGLTQSEEQITSLAAPALDELRAELNLPADPGGGQIRDSAWLTRVPPPLDRGPGSPTAAHRFRDTDPAPAERPSWAPDDDRPLVYLSFGSVAASLGFYPDLYRQAIEALAGLDIRLLVTVGAGPDPAVLEPFPAHVRVERWVPQTEVLPHAAAVICHGGYGTTLGALAAGVPLVLMPLFAGDQWQLARRVADIGAGIVLEDGPERATFEPPAAGTISELSRAVSVVVNERGYGCASGRIADAIAQLPPVDAAVDLLRAHAQEAGATNQIALGNSIDALERTPRV